LLPVAILVELSGLEIFGRHGLLPEERAAGQTFLYDVEVETSEGALSDRIEDAVDYREVAEVVRVVSEGKRFDLLEALAAAVADMLLARFDVQRVKVRVRKPRPYGITAEWAAATVERRP
jgi:7,8-dihydroneopterin aldolase/epimerase/oxygenase